MYLHVYMVGFEGLILHEGKESIKVRVSDKNNA